MEKLFDYINNKKDEILYLLEQFVNIDSGSYYKKGIDNCGMILVKELQTLDFQTEIIFETDWGNHVKAYRSGKGGKRVLLLTHLDTIWPFGTVRRFLFKIEGNFAYGPGVGDMKGGIVQMIYALKALYDLGGETPPISIFMTGDEEVGSLRGRPYIEEEAKNSEWVLVMESCTEPNVIVVRRWGVGAFYLTIRGIPAHVLDEKTCGVNASKELALKIIALESLSDIRRGIKVSVNLIKGGISRQVTASEARADIDVRVRDKDEMSWIEKRIREIAELSFLPGIQNVLKGGITRPPMEMNSKTESFLTFVKKVGREIGMEIQSGMKPGGSDGCFTSALGIATLDGLGPLCYDPFSEKERIEINNLILRTFFTSKIIQGLAREC